MIVKSSIRESLLPIKQMMERLELDKQESDQAYFFSLMYAGEFVHKFIITGLVAGITKDKDKHQYRNEHQLVRSDGIGEWCAVLNEILTGPTSQFTHPMLQSAKQELTQKKPKGAWEYECVENLFNAIKLVDNEVEDLPTKLSLKTWFDYFSRFRNSTRGHGAISGGICSSISSYLEQSLFLLIENCEVLKWNFCFVKRNLSGRFHVVKFQNDYGAFDFLKSAKDDWAPNNQFGDGIYFSIGSDFFFQRMAHFDLTMRDFYMPNGGFRNNRYELLSYQSGQKKYVENSAYITPPTDLPSSETSALKNLDLMGRCFTNLPNPKGLYVQRIKLETELENILVDDRHPVVTLVGKGGIGKTTTALKVLPRICEQTRFDLIVWFSARDIDLLQEGIKPVKPDVLDIKDLAELYSNLVLSTTREKTFNSRKYMESELAKSEHGKILFVMDNFETVANPSDVYNWLNTHIRLPNKLLITSRSRDFKADYPIEVKGMEKDEFLQLTNEVIKELKIDSIVDQYFLDELFDESQGHPYVIKILLGEVAREGKTGKIKRILASNDELLTALFERTYSGLSPVAKRIFLTLSNWRSTIPELAIEAILMREANEKMDVKAGIDELYKTSFVELLESAKDGSVFLSLPLAAFEFGRRKLNSSPMKTAVEVDTVLLQKFGPGKNNEVAQGVNKRIEKFFRVIARENSINKRMKLDLPVIEFICRRHHKSWLTLSRLCQENVDFDGAVNAAQNFVENSNDEDDLYIGWSRLYELFRYRKDYSAQVNSLIEIASLTRTDADESLECASKVLALFTDKKFKIDSEEKKLLILKLISLAESKVGNEYDDPDYCSTIAWLHLHLENRSTAKNWVKRGLGKNPYHKHCRKLAEILGLKVS